ncbi:hypothetical protein [Granulicella arctica]|uniref:hypothetical protein n=1 Tax=Granulicella arctica TaxID=940613 RepID=UPI0021DFF938|nr:hypothetical protein [Granulicella arctica]
MLSPKFGRVKQQHPGLTGLLDGLASYIRRQALSGQPYIIPKLAASALGLNDGEAFVLLELLSEGRILKRVYNVYCRDTGVLLATVNDPKALDDVPHCDFCDQTHAAHELRLELAYAPLDLDALDKAA